MKYFIMCQLMKLLITLVANSQQTIPALQGQTETVQVNVQG